MAKLFKHNSDVTDYGKSSWLASLLSSAGNRSREGCAKSIAREHRHGIPSILALCAMALGAFGVGNASAQTTYTLTVAQSPVQFSCDKLYVGTTLGGGQVYEIVDPSSNSPSFVQLYGHSAAWGSSNPYSRSTIALGRYNGELNMYHWSWDNGSRLVRVPNGSVTSTTGAIEVSDSVPRPGTNTYNYWSGGEVNQLTGEIYYTGGEDSTFEGTFRMMLYNPVTGVSKPSGVISPASPADRLPGGNGAGAAYVASDMAIDAEGNAYLLVGNGTARYLVRVVPGTSASGGDWVYNRVTSITGLPGVDVWGMAFLNGKLYASDTPRNLYEINVFTGVASRRGTSNVSGSIVGDYIYDLASCQTAPVIRGTVYNDANGNGVIDGGETGLAGVTVEIYGNNGAGDTQAYLGSRITSDDGGYSFITDDPQGTFYIRVKQPQIDGLNADQTYASAGNDGYNTVTAYCTDGVNDAVAKTSSGMCRGVRAGGTDATAQSLTSAQIYSQVVMTSDQKVAVADFGVTAQRDYGDAPETFGTTVAGAPAHVVNGKLLYLGADVSTEANGQTGGGDASADTFDDGVFVVTDAGEVALQDAVLIAGNSYTFNVHTSGDASSRGYLNAWINWGTSGSSPTFPSGTQIATDMQAASTGGVISVPYTVPSGSAAGVSNAFLRFRFSTANGLSATGNPAGTDSTPWVINGEVEDYRTYVIPGKLTLAAKSIGGTATFTYDPIANISGTAPSTATDSITTDNADEVKTSTATHAYASITQPIVITQTLPTGWGLVTAVCADAGAPGNGNPTGDLPVTISNGVVTIPVDYVRDGGNITCTFTNGKDPSLELIKTVGTRASADDQFTVQISDDTPAVVTSATTSGTGTTATTSAFSAQAAKVYTLNEVMAAGSANALGRYDATYTCTNGFADSATVLPADDTAGTSFQITPTYGDAIQCTFSNTTLLPSAATSTLAVTTGDKIADNSEFHTATATILDASNRPVSGETVTFALAPSTGASLASATCVTGEDGTCAVNITATLANTYQVSATIDISGTSTALSNSPQSVTFVADVVSVGNSRWNVSSDGPKLADGIESYTVTAYLRDANGNAVADSTGLAYTPSTGGTVSAPTSCTLGTWPIASGGDDAPALVCTSTWVSTTSGTNTVNATIDGTALTPASYDREFTAQGASATESGWVVSNDGPKVANNSDAYTITAYLRDENGNAAADSTGLGYTASTGGTVSGTPTCVAGVWPAGDGGDGEAALVCTSTWVSTTSGTNTVNATIGGTALTPASYDREFTAQGASATESGWVVSNDGPKVANNSDAYTITAYLRDENGNAAADSTGLGYTASTGGTVSGTPTCVAGVWPAGDGGDGEAALVCTSTWVSTTSGTNTVNATIGGTALTPASYDREFTAQGASATESGWVVSNDGPKLANNSDAYTITAYLRDENGNAAADSTGLGYTASTGGTVSGAPTCVAGVWPAGDGGDGEAALVCTSTWVSTTSGTNTVNATINGTALTPASYDREFTAQGASATESGWVVSNDGPKLANNSDAYTITAYLRDENGNAAADSTGLGYTASTGGTVSGTPTCVAGVWPASDGGDGEAALVCTSMWVSTTSGTNTVNATIGGTALTPASYDREFTAQGASATESGWVVSNDGPKVANNSDAYTITAYLRDENGNAAADSTGLGYTASTGGTVSGTPTCVAGVWPASDGGDGAAALVCTSMWVSTTSGTNTVNATIGGTALTPASYDREFTAQGASATESGWVVSNDGPKLANNSDAYTITAYLRDENGNAAADSTGLGYTASTGGTVSGTPTCVAGVWPAGDGGDGAAALVCTSMWVSTTSGTNTVNATIGGTALTPASYDREFTAQGASATESGWVVSNDGPKVANNSDAYTITAYLRDENGNAAADSTGLGYTASTGGTVSGTPTCVAGVWPAGDGGDGEAALVCTSTWVSTTSGTNTVNATIGGTALTPASYDREFTAQGASATESGWVVSNDGPKLANNSDAYTITAYLRDENGNAAADSTGLGYTASTGGTVSGTPTCVAGVWPTGDGGDGEAALVCTSTWVSTTSGTNTVNATIGGTALTPASYDREFTAQGASATESGWVVSNDGPKLANNSDAYTITAYLRDENGNAAADSTGLGYTASTGGTVSGAPTCVAGVWPAGDGGDGEAALVCTSTWVSTTSGTNTVNATINGTALTPASYDREFTAQGASATESGWVVSNDGPKVANNSDAYTITAYLRDENGNAAADSTGLGYTASTGGTVSGTPTCVAGVWPAGDGGDGEAALVCTSTWVSTTSGTNTVNATIGGTALTPASYDREFTAQGASATESGWVVSNDGPKLANNSDAYTITAYLRDENGNAAADSTGLGYTASTGGTVSGTPTCVAGVWPAGDGGDGEAALVCTSTWVSTTSGTNTVNATIGGTALTPASYDREFTAQGASATESGWVVSNDGPKLANNSDAYTITAYLRDENGNAAADSTGLGYTASTGGTVSGTPTCVAGVWPAGDGGDGEAALVCTSTWVSTTSGTNTVNATIGGTALTPASYDREFTAQGASATESGWVVSNDGPKLANNSDAYTITAYLRDENGNAAADSTGLGYTASTGGTVSGTPTCVAGVWPAGDGGDGEAALVCTSTWVSTTSGTNTVNATIGGTALMPASYDREFTAQGASATESGWVVSNDGPKLANNSDAYTITAYLRDENGNAAADSTGLGYTASTGGTVSGTPTCVAGVWPAGDGGDGEAALVCTSTWVSTTSGTNTVNATIGGTALTPASYDREFTAQGASATESGWVVSNDGPKLANNSDAYTITAYLRDENGNAAADSTGLGYTASTGGTVSGTPTCVAGVWPAGDGGDGEAALVCTSTWVSTTSGTNTVNATIGGTALTPASYDREFTAQGASATESGWVVSNDGPKVANNSDAYTITAYLRDENGNAAADSTGLGYTASTGGTVSGTPTCVAGVWPAGDGGDGEAALVCTSTWVSTTSGTNTVNATIGGTALMPASYDREFTAQGASATESGWVVSNDGPKVANNSDAYTITAYLRDENGNAAADSTGLGYTASTGGTVSGTPTCVAGVWPAGDGGDGEAALVCTSTWVSTTSGTNTVNATIGGTALTPASYDREFTAQNASATESGWVVSNDGPKLADGIASYTVTAYLRDENGNAAADSTGLGYTASTGGTVSGTPTCVAGVWPASDGGDGEAALVCTSTWVSTTSGTNTVNATIGGTALTPASYDREFTAQGASATESGWVVSNDGPKLANNSDAYTITAYLRDENGNAAADSTGLGYTASTGGTVSGTPTCVAGVWPAGDGGDGEAALVCTSTWVSTTSGTNTVNATIGGTALTPASYDREFTAQGASATESGWVVSNDGPKLADGIASYTVTAYLRDENGNAAADSTGLGYTASTGGAVSGTPTCVVGVWPAGDGGDGEAALVCTSTWVSTTSGTNTVNATIGGTALTPASYDREFTAQGASATESGWVVSNDGPKVANNTDAYTITAYLRDENGNAAADSTGLGYTASTGGTVSGTPTCVAGVWPAGDGGDGEAALVCTSTWVSTTSGTNTVNATIGGTALTPASYDREFTAQGASATESGWVVSNDGPKLADGIASYTVTAYLRDENGNAAADITGLAYTASAGGTVNLPTGCTVGTWPVADGGDGEAALVCTSTWVSTTSGMNTVNATINGTALTPASYDREFLTLIDLTMVKAASTDTLGVGQEFTYTLTYTNSGAVDATSVSFKDMVPNGINITAVSPSATCTPATPTVAAPFVGDGSSVLSCTVPLTVAADGGTGMVTLTAKVMPAALGTQPVNTASWSDDGGDPDDPSPGCTVNCSSNPPPDPVENGVDLTMVKSASTTELAVGTAYSYTLTFTNSGSGDASSVSFKDLVPAGIQITAVTPAGTCNQTLPFTGDGSTILSCTVPLTVTASGGTGTVTLAAVPTVAALGTQPVNTASWSDDGGDPDDPSPGCTVNCSSNPPPDPVENGVDLTMVKSASTTELAVGTAYSYTLTYTNSGSGDASSVSFKDLVPAGIQITAVTPAGTCNQTLPFTGDGSTILSCTVPLTVTASGGTGTVTLAAVPTAAALGTQPVNTASWSDDGGDPDDPSPGCTVNCSSNPPPDPVENGVDLTMVKSASTTELAVGTAYSYTLTFTNSGSGDASSVSFKDLVPAGIQITAVTPAGTCNQTLPFTGDGSTILSCTVPLTVTASGGTGTVTLAAVPTAAALGTQPVNTASWSDDGGDPEDPTPGCTVNCSSNPPPDPVENGVDLTMVKSASTTELAVGTAYSYTLTYTNSGTGDASSVSFKDLVPVGIQITAVTPAGTCNQTLPFTGDGSTILSCTVPLTVTASGGTGTVTLAAVPTAAALGTQPVNTASWSDDGGDPDDPSPGCTVNCSSNPPPDPVENGVDLTMVKSASTTELAVGTAYSYTLTFTNSGSGDASSVSFKDLVPAGIQITAVTPAGTCNQTLPFTGDGSTILSCTVPLTVTASGGTGTVTLAAVPTAAALGTQPVNTASWSDDGGDPDDPSPGCTVNCSSNPPPDPVENGVDLTMVKSASTTELAVGTAYSYTLTYTNSGTGDASSVSFKDLVPAGIQITAVTPAGTCNQTLPFTGDGSTILSCTVPLTVTASGGTGTVTLAAVPTAAALGTQPVNTASWSDDGGDPDDPSPGCTVNCSSNPPPDPVENGVDLTMVKSASTTELAVGTAYSYTLTFTNSGSGDASSVSFKDLVPAGIQITAVTPAGTCNQTLPFTGDGSTILSCTVPLTVTASGGTGTVTLAAVPTAAALGTQPVNTASWSDDGGDPDDPSPGCTVNCSSNPPPDPVENGVDLTMVKSASTTELAVGTAYSYTLTYTNSGTGDASSVSFKDLVPAGIQITAVTPAGTCNQTLPFTGDGSTILSCTVPLTVTASGGTGTVTLAAVPTAAALGTQPVNTASWSDDGGDPDDPSPGCTVNCSSNPPPDPVENGVDLTMVKSASTTELAVGTAYSYTLTFTNSGSGDASSVSFKDLVPAGIQITAVTPAGTCNQTLPFTGDGSTILSCTVPLTVTASGGTGTVTLAAVPTAAALGTQPVNTASWSDDGGDPDDPSPGCTVNCSSNPPPDPVENGVDLTMVKSASTTELAVGTAYSYTLTYTNSGTGDASSVSFKDLVPAGIQITAVTPAGTCNQTLPFTGDGSTILSCTVPLTVTASGGTGTVTLAAVPTAAALGTQPVNTASWSDDGGDPDDPSPGCTVNCSSNPPPDPVENGVDLTMVKSASTTELAVGTAYSYTLTFTNSGSGDASSVSFKDLVPAGIQITAVTPAGTCNQTLPFTGDGSTILSCTVPLTVTASGGTGTVTLAAVPTAAALGTQPVNTASWSDDGGDPDDPSPGCTVNCSSNPPPDPVENGVDLTMVKSASTTELAVGTAYSYTLTFTNSGSGDASSVSFKDLVPAGIQITAVTPAGTCNQTLPFTGDGSTILSCTVPLTVTASGGTGTVTLAAVPTAAALGTQPVNTASWSDDGGDPDDPSPGCTVNCSSNPPPDPVENGVDLTMVKSASTTELAVGAAYSYTLTFTNSGSGDASSVSFKDLVPAGIQITAVTPAGTCNQTLPFTGDGSTILSCTVPLTVTASGGTGTVTLAAVPTAAALGTQPVNTASWSDDGGDPDDPSPGCTVNCSSNPPPDPVENGVDLTMVKSASTTELAVGTAYSYTLTYTNSGSGDASSVSFKDLVPAGIQITAVTPAGTCNQTLPFTGDGSTILSCTVPLTVTASGGTGTVTLAAVPTAAALGTQPVNTASWSDDGGDPDDPSPGCTVNCSSNPPPDPVENGVDLTMVKSASTTELAVGAAYSYTLTFTNSGSGDASSVSFKDLVPAGIQITAVTPAGTCNQTLPFTGDGSTILSCTVPLTVTASGGTGTVTLAAVPTVAALGTQPVNTASWSDDGGDPDDPSPGCTVNCSSNPPPDPVVDGANLTMTKRIDGQPLSVGQPFNYVFTFANSGTGDASQVKFSDLVPAGITITAAPAGGTCTGGSFPFVGDGSNVLTCTVTVTVAANGGTATVTMPAVPNAAAVGEKPVNQASWSNGGEDPDPPGPGCQVNCTDDGGPDEPIGNGANLTMTKVIDGEPLRVGQAFNYMFTFTNSGTGDASQVKFSDLVPTGITITGAPAGATCTINGGAASFPMDGNGSSVLVCTVSTTVSANGGTAVVALPAMPNSAAAGQKPVNYASWSGPGTTDPENPGPGVCTTYCTDDGGPKTAIEGDEEGELRIVKQVAVREVLIGDLVRYTLTITNVGDTAVSSFSVIDTPSVGFSYVEDSAAVNNADTLTIAGYGPIEFGGLSLGVGQEVQIVYLMRVGAGARAGKHTNTAEAYDIAKKSISNRATADVTVSSSDPMLDESLILGTVYHDRNGNGVQDEGEEGIAGVRIASVEGLLIETDQFGRYHMEGIVGTTGNNHGRNFILKVDPSTLPRGAVFTTDNPLIRRITPGLPVRFDFGIQFEGGSPSGAEGQGAGNLDLEISDTIFATGSAEIRSEYLPAVERLADRMQRENVRRLILLNTADPALGNQRADRLRSTLQQKLGSNVRFEVIVESGGDAAPNTGNGE